MVTLAIIAFAVLLFVAFTAWRKARSARHQEEPALQPTPIEDEQGALTKAPPRLFLEEAAPAYWDPSRDIEPGDAVLIPVKPRRPNGTDEVSHFRPHFQTPWPAVGKVASARASEAKVQSATDQPRADVDQQRRPSRRLPGVFYSGGFYFCRRSRAVYLDAMTTAELKAALKGAMRGEVSDDGAVLTAASRDTSLFERMPELVVYPEDADDVGAVVKTISALRQAQGERADLSVTARSAGTDMSGGPLTTGVVVSFTKHMNTMGEVERSEDAEAERGMAGFAVTEPGVYYRDFEKATLEKGLILPSYPASRELAAMGGIVSNDAGGERTLKYGKTEKYVEELDVVLSDGSRALFKALTPSELEEKKKLQTLEGNIYREMDALLAENATLIEEHRPKVSKNSAGYALWSVRDAKTNTFNLAKLICGSQGTLALWTRAKLALVAPKGHRAMLVIFLHDLNILPEIVKRVLPQNPESFESFDDHTFTLAVKFMPQMLSQMGFVKAAKLGIDFIPEIELVATGGVPKLLLMAEFAEDTIEEADAKACMARGALANLNLKMKIEKNEKESEKYWIVRRESFNLLRKNLHGLHTAPFIDDFVVPPSCYPEFLPKLNALLDEYASHFIYTIAGHIGNGNFHIIPLMDLSKEENRQVILDLAPKVYELVIHQAGYD
ncbi:MAG: Oxidoreductase [Parcubacteria group bacterium GW2011_GWA1_54_9]|nr:MAG: Oxidoreductase [Parcubacteria group bacterium GW2011_GWA1_54_9]